MNVSRRVFLPLLLLVALLQTAALGYIVVNRDQLLKHGREIIMQVQPLDPRDLFRGDYVILGYPISQINVSESELPAGIVKGATFYAVLKPADNETWTVSRVASSYPADVTALEIVLRGRVQNVFTGAEGKGFAINARYGIETYFVPEGEGKVIEKQVLEKSVKAILAVGKDGETAIKGLVVDGVRSEHPPIF
jgi:uncharacterized membrane-anchored protein